MCEKEMLRFFIIQKNDCYHENDLIELNLSCLRVFFFLFQTNKIIKVYSPYIFYVIWLERRCRWDVHWEYLNMYFKIIKQTQAICNWKMLYSLKIAPQLSTFLNWWVHLTHKKKNISECSLIISNRVNHFNFLPPMIAMNFLVLLLRFHHQNYSFNCFLETHKTFHL